ncbi:MAG: carboxypeptidase regulatory-like domain-containing protein [Acidobacteria bacterium]|nr:carboxypeptidase regulatory-like domain-containing protein [Acidobacteriota bacterium]MBV9146110.1 carboxypeptidase regulatory-like domain-containing protein [Acidobacteriota bacterium]MBV9437217.1 carboxypeptidase regulatory-like domain-containing protein [Acidobacteriota bacterium]
MKILFHWAAPTVVALLLAANLSAADITGTVTNKTSNKPSAGDDVVLLKLSEGMQEASRTKTDAQGKFSMPLPDDGGQHLVRVTHQGVNYFKPAPSGTTFVQVDVYDSAKQVQGVTGRADIMRVQTDGGQLQVTELFVLQNTSSPPRTQMSERSFEFTLPEGAVVDASLAAGPGGMPVNSAPVPTGDKNHYAFVFPIRPGETKFQISYHAQYSSSFSFHSQVLTPTDEVAVMLPKSMEFKNATSDFNASGEEKGMNIYVAHAVAAGKQLAFTVSGTGQIPRDAQDGDAGSAPPAQDGSQGSADNRPGGGLGRPEETPDPLHNYRWWIFGGLAVALVVGAIVAVNQKPRTAAITTPPAISPAITAKPAAQGRGMLLEAMKEELFQLETERLQGRISETDYRDAKAALDLTIKRAIGRQGSSNQPQGSLS